jgi:hypothetical protein
VGVVPAAGVSAEVDRAARWRGRAAVRSAADVAAARLADVVAGDAGLRAGVALTVFLVDFELVVTAMFSASRRRTFTTPFESPDCDRDADKTVKSYVVDAD